MAMEMRGSLNVSKFYRNANQPRFYGKALINGVEYELKGWEKVNDKGEPWISLLFEEPFEQVAPTQIFSTNVGDSNTIPPAKAPARSRTHPLFDDVSDDIPF